MHNVFPKCEICGLIPYFGLYDGLRLGKKFICSQCEKQILQTKAQDPQYQVNVQNIKRIIYC
ncbi:MAG: hypothetical protein GX248_08095 [Peptococcaceae bacterium]|jgi:hypothetical protein|nr:hypothetical protein [Peptococcaceae bacterium]